MTAGLGLSPDRRVAVGDTPAVLIVILALPCMELTVPTEALPIGVATPMAAGDTFADCLVTSKHSTKYFMAAANFRDDFGKRGEPRTAVAD
jgi:hypothetical protein